MVTATKAKPTKQGYDIGFTSEIEFARSLQNLEACSDQHDNCRGCPILSGCRSRFDAALDRLLDKHFTIESRHLVEKQLRKIDRQIHMEGIL